MDCFYSYGLKEYPGHPRLYPRDRGEYGIYRSRRGNFFCVGALSCFEEKRKKERKERKGERKEKKILF